MRTLPSWLVLFLCLLASILVVGAGREALAQAPSEPAAAPDADSGPAPAQADANGVTPPQLKAFVDAGYPDDARAAGVTEASVTLVLTISADGSVEEASLSGTPAGYGF